MSIIIREHEYSPKLFRELKKFVFDLENKRYKFMCSEIGGLKCGKCLYCKCEKIKTRTGLYRLSRFYAFICHKDNMGGYVSRSVYGNDFFTNENIFLWEDLDKLKLEVKEINKYNHKLPEYLIKHWEQFYQDVLSSSEILELKYL